MTPMRERFDVFQISLPVFSAFCLVVIVALTLRTKTILYVLPSNILLLNINVL